MHKNLFALVAIFGLYGCSPETVQIPDDTAGAEATVSTTAQPVTSAAQESATATEIASEPGPQGNKQSVSDDAPHESGNTCKHVQNILNHKENSFCPKYRAKKCFPKDEDCTQCQTYEKCLVREAQDTIESAKKGRCRPLSKSDLERIVENCKDEAFVM